MTFTDHVLAWLQEEYPTAMSVTAVTGDGTDWAGGTEEGFTSRFDVTIQWVDDKGRDRFESVTGDRMESLWKWVVQAWPEESR